MQEIIIKLLIAGVAIFLPIYPALLAMGLLIFIDLVMGLVASYKMKIPFTSSRLKNTGVKMLIYNLLIISCFVAQTYLSSYIPFLNIGLAFLSVVEISSIGESFQKITGLSFLKFIKKYINEKLNNPKDK